MEKEEGEKQQRRIGREEQPRDEQAEKGEPEQLARDRAQGARKAFPLPLGGDAEQDAAAVEGVGGQKVHRSEGRGGIARRFGIGVGLREQPPQGDEGGGAIRAPGAEARQEARRPSHSRLRRIS